MKKHVLIVTGSFRIGGITCSLKNLLVKIDTSKYDIDLFVLDHYEPVKESFINCNILKCNSTIHELITHLRDTRGIVKLHSLMIKMLCLIARLFGFELYSYILKKAAIEISANFHYDTIISYEEGISTKFVSFMEASNKIAWIHCDYRSYWELNGEINESNMYSNIDTVVCVSVFTRKSFLKQMTEYNGNVKAIYNVIDSDIVRENASLPCEDVRFITDEFTIMTIGRIDPVKCISAIPKIAAELKQKKCSFRWYVIGPICDYKEYHYFLNNLDLFSVHDCVIYLGSQNNPYNYLANSNLLVSVSKSEACPYVINEAKILHIPVVCTNFGSASEFIHNGYEGLIVPIEKMADTISSLIMDIVKYKKIKHNVSSFEYDNAKIINEIEKII